MGFIILLSTLVCRHSAECPREQAVVFDYIAFILYYIIGPSNDSTLDSLVLQSTGSPKGLFVLSKGSFTGEITSHPRPMKAQDKPATGSRSNQNTVMRILGFYWKNWWVPRQDEGDLRNLRSIDWRPKISNGFDAASVLEKNERLQQSLGLIALIILGLVLAISTTWSKDLLVTAILAIVLVGYVVTFSMKMHRYYMYSASAYTAHVAVEWKNFMDNILLPSGISDAVFAWISQLEMANFQALCDATATGMPPWVILKVREIARQEAVKTAREVLEAERLKDPVARAEKDRKLISILNFLMMSEKTKYEELRAKVVREATGK